MKALSAITAYADKHRRTFRGAMRQWLASRTTTGIPVIADELDMNEDDTRAWMFDAARLRMLHPYDVETLEAIGDQYKKSQKKRRRALVALIKEEGADNYVNRRLKDPRVLAEFAGTFAGA